jgi:hypothetical protein
VQRAPGFPCALFFLRRRLMQLGRIAPRGCGPMSGRIVESNGHILRDARKGALLRMRGGTLMVRSAATPRVSNQEAVEYVPGGIKTRSAHLTIFWHCGLAHFSSRTAQDAWSRQRTVNGFGPGFRLQPGSGNADSQRKVWSFGWSGACHRYPGCVAAHPAYWRAAASYRPLRAVWAVCAWALRGCVS